VVAVVGAAETTQEGTVHIAKRAATVGKRYAFGAVFVFYFFQSVGNIIEGLVPANLAPFTLTAGTAAD